MTKHTPGPWEVFGDAQVIIRKPNRAGAMVPGNVCHVALSPRQISFGPRQDYQEALAERAANARLIATSPDLLELLREFVSHLTRHAPLGLNEDEVDMLRRAEAVIERAEGTHPLNGSVPCLSHNTQPPNTRSRTMAKHTPTPWIYDGDDPPNQGFSVAFPGGGTLATAYYCDDGEGREVAEANARLIAAA